MNVREKLLKVQTELDVPKGQYNKFGGYWYRNCEDILMGVKPLCAKVKATTTVSDKVIMIGERYYVEATAVFTDAESLEPVIVTSQAREADHKKGMDDSQLTGSSSSYARKYALNGLFGIDDNKDADTRDNTNPDKKSPASQKEKPTRKAPPSQKKKEEKPKEKKKPAAKKPNAKKDDVDLPKSLLEFTNIISEKEPAWSKNLLNQYVALLSEAKYLNDKQASLMGKKANDCSSREMAEYIGKQLYLFSQVGKLHDEKKIKIDKMRDLKKKIFLSKMKELKDVQETIEKL